MKNPDFLVANLKVLHKQNAPIVRWLADQGATAEDLEKRVIINGRGLLDWSLPTGRGLFDAISPQMAYRDWISEEKADTSATIVVGCNLGYGVNQVLANTPESHRVLVFEPRPEMILACLAQTDYRCFFESKKLSFVPATGEFVSGVGWKMATQCVFGNVIVRSDMPSRQLGPEYAVWFSRIEKALENFSCEFATLRSGQDIMVKNELRNFSRTIQDGSLLSLRNKARGVSAVVLGAGPSVTKFAPLLAASQAEALYVCGLQTIPILRKYGLKPHVCMAVDYTRALKRVYDRLDPQWLSDIPLLYSPTLNPEVLKGYPGPTHPLWTLGGLSTNLPREREFVLDAGGNVGVALARFLVWCGVDRILLAGQDFSWSGDRTHAAGHLADNNRFHFVHGRHVEMKNKDGKSIYSDLAYVTPLRALERDLKRWTLPVFNLYGGGAMIKGSTDVTWQEVVAEGLLFSTPGRVQGFLDALRRTRTPRYWPIFEARSSQWANSLRSVQRRLERLFKRASKHQREIRAVLAQVLIFLRQDPLYQPYLFKEIIKMTGLVQATRRYGGKELTLYRQIAKKVMHKVREMDLFLVHNRKAA